jgi:hypothetical protein
VQLIFVLKFENNRLFSQTIIPKKGRVKRALLDILAVPKPDYYRAAN